MGISKIKKIRLSKYDALWSKAVRERDGQCQVDNCNETERLNAHHIKGRSCKSTRLFLPNGISLCPKHHVFSSEFSPHKTPEAFDRWFKETFPERHRAIIVKAQTMMSEREAIKEFINLNSNGNP
jgi:hypothetical protein